MADDCQADWFFDWLATDRLPWIWQLKVTKYQYLLIVWQVVRYDQYGHLLLVKILEELFVPRFTFFT